MREKERRETELKKADDINDAQNISEKILYEMYEVNQIV